MNINLAHKIFIFSFLTLSFFALLMFVTYYLLPKSNPGNFSQEDKFISVLGSKIRYRITEGDEPTLLLLHGFGGSLNEWDKVQPKLSYRSIAIDLLGFGKSDRPCIPYTLNTHRLHILELLKKLNINKAIVVGRSMGASITASAAASSNDKIKGIILIAPSAFPGSLNARKPYNLLFHPGFLNNIVSIIVSNPIYMSFFPNSLASQALGVTSSYDYNFAASLSTIRQPTLLAWSPGDTTTPFRFHTEYLKRISNVDFIKLPKHVGHVTVKTYPDGTANFINEFTRKIHSPLISQETLTNGVTTSQP